MDKLFQRRLVSLNLLDYSSPVHTYFGGMELFVCLSVCWSFFHISGVLDSFFRMLNLGTEVLNKSIEVGHKCLRGNFCLQSALTKSCGPLF